MWNNTTITGLKREENCVIIISQIAIDCKNKRFTMIYDSVSEEKCAGQRSAGVGIIEAGGFGWPGRGNWPARGRKGMYTIPEVAGL